MIIIDTWKGLVTNGSPYALPQAQRLCSRTSSVADPVSFSARGGQAAATFSTTAGCTAAVIEMFRCPIGASESVVIQGADGHIYVAKGLT